MGERHQAVFGHQGGLFQANAAPIWQVAARLNGGDSAYFDGVRFVGARGEKRVFVDV